MIETPYLPYGIFDLDPQIYTERNPTVRVRCYVEGCTEMLRPPSRYDRGDVCPVHGIRCHLSGTYTYPNPRRNIIASPAIFASRIIKHPFKFESWRMGNEKSEDALTWNVFRSLQEAGCLHLISQWVTGVDIQEEPQLYLWGISIDDRFQPWALLVAARERFESRLPVKRPSTEPDIGLYLPGHFLILIEAKFTSPNPVYTIGPRQNAHSLTKAELLEIYTDLMIPVLDVAKAREAERVHAQLWRNMIFANWMAMFDGLGTKGYLGSLTRAWWENDSCNEFAELIQPGYEDRFCHIRWEDIYTLAGLHWRKLSLLQQYILTKSAGLQPAFQLGLW